MLRMLLWNTDVHGGFMPAIFTSKYASGCIQFVKARLLVFQVERLRVVMIVLWMVKNILDKAIDLSLRLLV